MTATVVLVHGAWHGSWCWERLVPRLEAAGVRTLAIDLPGHGADPGPFTDLFGDADRVTTLLDGLDGPVVLTGHSYGGAVITDAGLHPSVAHLVYVTAFAIDETESLASTAIAEDGEPGTGPAPEPDSSPGLAEVMVLHDDGTTTLPTEAVGRLLYNACDAETQRWAGERVGPQPFVTFTQSPRAVAWRERPSTYVVCERDRGVAPALQRVFAGRGGETVALDTDHSPFASCPDDLAEVLAGIARRY